MTATFIGTWFARREHVRKQVASFINAEPDEIGLTINTSSGMNLIVDALEKHGEVISCDLEFPVTTIPWMQRRIPVHLVKSVEGVVRTEDLRAAMNTRTGIISMSYVQFSNGFRCDLEELASIKGKHALVVNASQAAGAFEIDEADEDRCALLDRTQVDAFGIRVGVCLYQQRASGGVGTANDRMA